MGYVSLIRWVKLHPPPTQPESIEWFIEDQAFSWFSSSPTPSRLLRLSRRCLSFSVFLCRRLSLQMGWGMSQIMRERESLVGSSINHQYSLPPTLSTHSLLSRIVIVQILDQQPTRTFCITCTYCMWRIIFLYSQIGTIWMCKIYHCRYMDSTSDSRERLTRKKFMFLTRSNIKLS